jgi:hypothetical protein
VGRRKGKGGGEGGGDGGGGGRVGQFQVHAMLNRFVPFTLTNGMATTWKVCVQKIVDVLKLHTKSIEIFKKKKEIQAHNRDEMA